MGKVVTAAKAAKRYRTAADGFGIRHFILLLVAEAVNAMASVLCRGLVTAALSIGLL
jgi:hypothetical protein